MVTDPTIDASGPWTPCRWERAPGQIVAICDRCSIMLARPMAMRNTEGRVITVGCDCAAVVATLDADPVRKAKVLAKIAAIQKQHVRDAKTERDERKAQELTAMLADEGTRAKLAAKPHPTAFLANTKSLTLLDWASWMVEHAGAAGKAKTLGAVKAALK